MFQAVKNSHQYILACRKIAKLFEEVRARQEYTYGIADAISRAYPFSPFDIWQAHNILKSWDEVICLCEYCCSYGLKGVYHSIGFFYERNDGIAFRAAFWRSNKRVQADATPPSQPKSDSQTA